MGTKRLKRVLALVLALTLCFSTNVTTANAAKKVTVKSIKVVSPAGSKKVVYVAKGKSVKLTTKVKATPNKKANKKVTYKSANTAIATVTNKGVVKGIKLGTTKITVKSVKNAKKKKTIKVKVVQPVSKVKLNKKKLNLAPGQTAKLKAKVTAPKNSFKTLKWTSSNKKVATVTKKGVVKAVGEGTAKIKATSLDGTKKKSTCTVKVANGIKSITISPDDVSEYAGVVKVTLYGKQVLTEKDFNVSAKILPSGTYNRKVNIDAVLTSDNINYFLYINEYDDILITNGIYFKVKVNALKGVKKAEKQYRSVTGNKKQTISGTVGKEIETMVSYNSTSAGFMDMKIESGTLPKGLKYNAATGNIEGVPQAIANNQKVTFVQTDELGVKSRNVVTFIISDDKNIVAESKTIGDDKENPIYAYESINEKITVRGGSGQYKYTLLNDGNGLFYIDSQSSGGFYVRTNDEDVEKSGTYVIKVKVTDAANADITTVSTLIIKVTAAHKVTITFNNLDEYNNYGNIYLVNLETGKHFSIFDSTYSSKDVVSVEEYAVPKGKYMLYYNRYSELIIEKSISVNGTTNLEYNVPDNGDINVTVRDKKGNVLNYGCVLRMYKADRTDRYLSSFEINDGEHTFRSVARGKYIVEVCTGSEVVRKTVTVTNKDVDVTIQLKSTVNTQ